MICFCRGGALRQPGPIFCDAPSAFQWKPSFQSSTASFPQRAVSILKLSAAETQLSSFLKEKNEKNSSFICQQEFWFIKIAIFMSSSKAGHIDCSIWGPGGKSTCSEELYSVTQFNERLFVMFCFYSLSTRWRACCFALLCTLDTSTLRSRWESFCTGV